MTYIPTNYKENLGPLFIPLFIHLSIRKLGASRIDVEMLRWTPKRNVGSWSHRLLALFFIFCMGIREKKASFYTLKEKSPTNCDFVIFDHDPQLDIKF